MKEDIDFSDFLNFGENWNQKNFGPYVCIFKLFTKITITQNLNRII